MGLDDKLEPVENLESADVDVEEGELFSDDEEVKADKRDEKIQDLRNKLSNQSNSPVVCNKDETSINQRIPNISKEIKACLGDYSAEDIEMKLIPFKKRQFNELQFEEIKLK